MYHRNLISVASSVRYWTNILASGFIPLGAYHDDEIREKGTGKCFGRFDFPMMRLTQSHKHRPLSKFSSLFPFSDWKSILRHFYILMIVVFLVLAMLLPDKEKEDRSDITTSGLLLHRSSTFHSPRRFRAQFSPVIFSRRRLFRRPRVPCSTPLVLL